MTGPHIISEYFVSQKKTKTVEILFFKDIPKNYQLPILGTLDMTGHFSQKNYNANFDVYLHAKNELLF